MVSTDAVTVTSEGSSISETSGTGETGDFDNADAFWMQLSESLCGQMEGCLCANDDPAYATVAACHSQQLAIFDADRQTAQDNLLPYNEDCALLHLSDNEDLMCGDASDEGWHDRLVNGPCTCSVYQGTIEDGEPCPAFTFGSGTPRPLFNACAEGLMCSVMGFCMPEGPSICDTALSGETCASTYIGPDGITQERRSACPPAHFCGDLDSQLCEPDLTQGTPCEGLSSENPCGESMYCVAGQCTVGAAMGELCAQDEDCAEKSCDLVLLECSFQELVCY